jgi:hypothetical protein
MKSFLFVLLFTISAFGQTFIVSEGSSFNIDSNSSISIEGLQLSPSTSFTISGPNTINRSSIPVVVGVNVSISRVYEMDLELPNYLGLVTFSYDENDLNDIPESDLVIEVFDENGVWTNVTSTIDMDNNTLSHNFTQTIGLNKITASSINSTLSINTETLNDIVKVYPNPTTDKLFILSQTILKSTLYNISGQKILESNSTDLNIKDISSGIYFLVLKNNQNKISTFKIIKK